MKKVLGIASVELNEYYPFGKQTFYFEDMARESIGCEIDLLFFSPLDWEAGAKTIDGFMFKDNKWIKIKSDFPKIIYDRSFAKTREGKNKINELRTYLKEEKIPVLNPIDYADLLNHKIEFHEYLLAKEFPTLKALPVEYILTREFAADLQVTAFYLKPTAGTGGFGIHVIQQEGDFFLLKNHTNTEARRFDTIRALFDFINVEINPEEHFVQPRANVVSFDASPLDIRVLVQNYGAGDYRVTGAGARIGRQNSFVSNLNSGGSAIALDKLADYYRKHFNKNISEEIETISGICLRCCQALDKTFGNFLEIGFDILLTKDKGPIILEGNSKPSRWIFNVLADQHPGEAEKYRKLRSETVRVPLLFAEKNYPAGL